MGLGPQENISESGDYEIHMYDQLIRRIELWYKTRAQIAPELKELEHELVVLKLFFSALWIGVDGPFVRGCLWLLCELDHVVWNRICGMMCGWRVYDGGCCAS